MDLLAYGERLVRQQLRPPRRVAVAIFGCGDIGLGAVVGAREAGCSPIIVVDSDVDRLLAACELGATHVIDPETDDPVAAIRSLRSRGVRFVVDTTGAAPTGCLAPLGRWTGPAATLHHAA